MKKEDILRMSQNENADYDERERSIHTKSSAIAKAAGVAIGFIIALIETCLFHRYAVASISAFSVGFSMDAAEAWFRFAHLKGKFNLINSILSSVCAAALIASLIIMLCKTVI